MRQYNLRRYDALGTCYGERILTGTRKQCLEHIRKYSMTCRKFDKIKRTKNKITLFCKTNTYQYHIEAV